MMHWEFSATVEHNKFGLLYSKSKMDLKYFFFIFSLSYCSNYKYLFFFPQKNLSMEWSRCEIASDAFI